eukprot:356968-Chlamydomonas_euryale.AAC.23
MSELVFDHLHATAFQDNPLGRTILGPVENIKSINRNQLVEYIKTHYRGPRVVIAAAGAVDHEQLVQLVSKAFGSVPDEEPASNVHQLIQKEPSFFTGSYVHDPLPDTTECSFAVAFKGASWSDPDSIPLMVMQTMMGGWDKNVSSGRHASNQLTQTVSTEGLADAFMAFNTNYHDTGLFGVYGVTDRERCQAFASAIMSEMTKLCYEVDGLEVLRAKNQLKASMLFFQDSTHQVAESIGRELLVYGRRLPKAELFARIDAVDAETVRAVANRFIYDQDMAIAAAGDTSAMPDYDWFRKRSYTMRS